jgi:hypothetical protein
VGRFVQRYYDPQIGRFLSVDPVAANANTGAMFNRYNYANNNPYRFTDPDGRAPQDNWYGYNDQRFRDWVHAEKQLEGRGGARNYTKADLKHLHSEWKELGEPRGKGGTSGRGGGERGFVSLGLLWRLNVFISTLMYSSDLNAGEQEALDRRRAEPQAGAGDQRRSGGESGASRGGAGGASEVRGNGMRGTYNSQTGEAKVRLAPETGTRISRTVTVCADKSKCGG